MSHQPEQTLAVLKSILGQKVVSFHSIFARALRNVPAGVMLSQGFFWQENAQFRQLREIDGISYFTATASEWYDATGVTDDQQLTARDVLRSSGFWTEKRAGLPAKLYYHIDLDILVSVIYGFLENGKQVSVDTRHKNREITRASDGKFRQPVSVNHGNNIIKVESLESFDSSRESSGEKKLNVDSKKKEKAPLIAARPPANLENQIPTTFQNSIWATATVGAWATALHAHAPESVDADAGYYLRRCRDWSAKHPNRGYSNWLAFAAQIIDDDRRRGKLVTLKPIEYETDRRNHGSFIDRDAATRRAHRVARRLVGADGGI